MTYFADLAPCTYFGSSRFPPLTAVGWLDATHTFPVGDPGVDVFERLQKLREMQWLPIAFLGAHSCELCRYGPALASKDLFIPGDGVTYAAPQGIVHYIGCHGYLPPEEFCEAVRRCPPPDTLEFFAALRRNGWSERDAHLTVTDPLKLMATREIAFHARGEAICAAVKAVFMESANYPESLGAVEALMTGATWTYARNWRGFVVRGEWEIEGLKIVFDSQRDWGRRDWQSLLARW